MTAGLLIGMFLFVMAAVTAAGYVFVLRPMRDGAVAVELPRELTLEHKDLPAPQAAVVGALRMIGEVAPGGAARTDAARRRLIAAGFRWPSAVQVFFGIKAATALLAGVLALWGSVSYRGDLSYALMPAVCGLAFGYLLPNRVLERLARARIDRLRRALPSALDLMVLAIEAGQGLDAALIETSHGLRATHPDLAAEFTQLQLELKANTTRADALRNLAERTRDLELKKFANLLIDTDRFGTSLGPALKTHARYLRIRFRQISQERARKVAVKLIFPVFFLIFPSVILVTLAPAVILFFTQMKSLLE